MSLTQRSTLAALLAALTMPLAHTDSAHASTVPSTGPLNRATRLVIDGAGDGHGVGMSQDGALGYALHGYSYEAILAHYYSGSAIGQAPPGRIVRVLIGDKVERVPLERYVRGVVSAEVPATWPSAALEAQAVASRTYALTADAGGPSFDVYADARSQVYKGSAAETPQTNAAVAATAGQIVTYEGRPAITYFFASSGGMTEDVQNSFPGAEPEPWLLGVPDPYEEGALHRWTISMTMHAATARLRGLVRGSLRGVEVLKRGYSPRILSAALLGSKGRTMLSGPELAARLGLYSTWAYFSIAGPGGTRPEPDLSHYSPPAGDEGRGTPGGAGAPGAQGGYEGGGYEGGGSAATPPALAPSSEDGGVAAALSPGFAGGTPSG
jgi:stage II sporulation protein D